MSAWLLAGSMAVHAAEPAGATFVDDAAVSASIAPGESVSVPVDVVNGGDGPVVFTLRVSGIDEDEAAAFTLTPSPGADGTLSTSDQTAPGEIWPVGLDVLAGSDASTPLTARLIVVSSDGTVARRDLTVSVTAAATSEAPCVPQPEGSAAASVAADESIATVASAAPSSSPSPEASPCPEPEAADSLAEPLLGSITVSVERNGLLAPTPSAAIPIDPGLAAKLVAGALITDTGLVGRMTVDPDGMITLVGDGPGAYKGTISREATGDEKAPVKLSDLTLNVRDDWWLAIFVLVAGLFCAIVVEWIATDQLPWRRVKARLVELQEVASRLATEHEAAMQRSHAADPTAPDRWPGGDTTSPRLDPLMSGWGSKIKNDWDDTSDASTRNSRWGVDGSEFKKLVDVVSTFEGVLMTRLDVAASWHAVRTEMSPDLQGEFEASDLSQGVFAALGNVPLPNERVLNAYKDSVVKLANRLAAVAPLAQLLGRMPLLDPGDAEYIRKINILWQQVAALGPGDLGELTQLTKEALELQATKLDQSLSTRAGLRAIIADRGLVVLHEGEMLAAPRSAAVSDAPEAAETPAEARSALRAWTLGSWLLIVPIVVIVAMSTLYFGKPTFGSAADYVAVFVWAFAGTAAGSIVKLGAASAWSFLPRR